MSEYTYGHSSQAPVFALDSASRARFVTRTYLHLFAAILGFAAIETALFATGVAYPIAQAMLSVNWLLVLGAFVISGWLFNNMALRSQSLGAQYVALAGYVLVQSIIFVPMLVIAEYSAPGAISSAAVATLFGFSGLTAVAMITRKDFSFLGGILRWAFVVALVLIVCGVLFGFELGVFFSVAMIALAGAAILYDTSNVLRHYPEDRYVGAALSLFASVALMFWYVLRLFTSRD